MVMELGTIRSSSRQSVLRELKTFFKIQELVCSHVYNRFGENAWQFLDTDLLRFLLWVRLLTDKPITVNNYHSGGSYSQRGLRCNKCDLVATKTYAYVSAHILGKAVDMTVEDMDAEEVRSLIKENKSSLPCQLRLEEGVSWVHGDVRSSMGYDSDDYCIITFTD